MYKFLIKNEIETLAFAKAIAKKLNKGDIIILTGDLGAGKTKFTEGFLSFYGLENEISSPTFTIVNEYLKDDINIYHFDVYRLEDLDEFYAIGGDEYFEKGISLIEWGEMIEEILPPNYIKINIEKDSENTNLRYFNVETHGDKFNNLFNDFKTFERIK